MQNFRYFMPTELLIGRNIIIKKYDVFKNIGDKALIITGKHSSKNNGSLEDCIFALNKNNIKYCIYDNIEENPSIENIEKGAKFGKENNVNFCIGIGGGSPMDATKAIGILIKNQKLLVNDLLQPNDLQSIPLVAIPTTAGTGSETTQYSIVTVHDKQTKQSFPNYMFFNIAFLDAKYMLNMPKNITVSTSFDALTHLIESYLCTNSNYMTDHLCESGFYMFKDICENLKNFNLSFDDREKLLLLSSLAGICISQTGTSIPHALGYSLTYFKNIPHGIANILLIPEYLKFCDTNKVEKMLKIMKFNTVDDFKNYIHKIIENDFIITKNELEYYTEKFFESNKNKLETHPNKLTYDNILNIYLKSFCL